jgi:hypothetical protein
MKNPSSKILLIFLILTLSPVCSQAAQSQIAARRRQIEQTYNAELAELYKLAEIYANKISAQERLLWIEFVKQKRLPYAYPCTYSLYGPFIRLNTLKRHESRLRGDMIENYSLRNFAMLLLDNKAYCVLSKVADSRVQGVSLRRKALALLAIMDQLRVRAEDINAHRDAQLARLETWIASADRIKAEEPAPIRIQPPSQQLGLVSAISYDGDNSLCMVEGVDEILMAGDVISTDQVKGIKVIGISRNAVEFQKNNQTWTQTLGQTPKAVWTK